MTLQELLVERGLTSALIIDDAYDNVPTADDLGIKDPAWPIFFQDIGSDAAIIADAFPLFNALDGQELKQRDDFVAALWSLKDRLRPELQEPLFRAYQQGVASDKAFLGKLESALTALGLIFIRSGRNVSSEAKSAGIIFVDLYLGAAQSDPDRARSIKTIIQLLEGRESSPPLVILMSRSDLLVDKKVEYRDSAGLLGSLFRVYKKEDLIAGSTLNTTLERLATHRPDAVRVAAFAQAWKTGLADAVERFLKGIRRLDLPDYVQIRNVLLMYEGQPLGSYLLDVFDKLLQHEIEGDAATIEAAEELNKVNVEAYPPPYVDGSPDFQMLAYRTIWQNPLRLSVRGSEAGIPVSFGDVMIRRSVLARAAGATRTATADDAEALVALTPACDCVREDGAKRILFMAGKIAPLTHQGWTYSHSSTPIVVLPGDDARRVAIQWNMKDLRTLLPSEISNLLAEAGEYDVALRLRDAHALELQQRLLGDMGRVGVIAQMPATFPVEVNAYRLDASGQLVELNLSTVKREGGVCYTGRDQDGKENTRLVLTEAVVDELVSVIRAIDDDLVHPKALVSLQRAKSSSLLGGYLSRGLPLSPSTKRDFFRILVPSLVSGDRSTPDAVGLCARNPPTLEVKDRQSAGFVLVLRDSAFENESARAIATVGAPPSVPSAEKAAE